MIDWRPAAPGARVLPFASAFLNSEWSRDKWDLSGPGEVVGEPRKANNRLAIPGLLGLTPCGDADWYARGMPYEPLSPPCVRDANGLPACCALPPRVSGVMIGGKSPVSYTPRSPGGVQVGGEAGDVYITTDATSGGIEVGGSAGDEWSYLDGTAGGLEVGGSAGDVNSWYDTTEGGLEVGGSSGDGLEGTDATAGGLEVGGSSGDGLEGTDATAGGLEVGGSSGDAYDETMPIELGIEVGGEAGDVYGYPAPVVTSATVESNGTTLTVVWDRPVNFASGDITIGGTQSTIATYTSGGGSATTVWTIASTILISQTVTADYPAALVTSVEAAVPNVAVTGGSVTNTSTAGGAPTPGTTCATAGAMTLGFPATVPLPGSTSELWLKCNQPASGAFKVTYTMTGMMVMLTMYQDAGCGTLGPGTVVMFSGCTGFTVSPGMTMFLKFSNSGMSAGSITVTVATGTC